MFLVDTSVWIEVFRRPSRFELGSVADLDEVVTCLPVIQEVLQGFPEEHAFRVAREGDVCSAAPRVSLEPGGL
jgi:predicted nucleic acid-binding protein